MWTNCNTVIMLKELAGIHQVSVHRQDVALHEHRNHSHIIAISCGKRTHEISQLDIAHAAIQFKTRQSDRDDFNVVETDHRMSVLLEVRTQSRSQDDFHVSEMSTPNFVTGESTLRSQP